MTKAEIFHREMLSRGGRADVPPNIESYEQIRRRFETLAESASKLLPSLPQIHFDFIFSGSVNACAFRSNGMYFVGVTTGAIFMVHFLVMRMLSDARLFPFTGDPNDESGALPPITGYVPDAQQIYDSGLRPERPKSKARLSYAGHLIDSVLLLLMGHELAHITLGHVDYVGRETNVASIVELTWIDPGTEKCIERQALEMQADMRSTYSGVASLIETHKTHSTETPPWASTPRNEGNLIFDWAFAMNLFFPYLAIRASTLRRF